jgi:hypothetical protein
VAGRGTPNVTAGSEADMGIKDHEGMLMTIRVAANISLQCVMRSTTGDQARPLISARDCAQCCATRGFCSQI